MCNSTIIVTLIALFLTVLTLGGLAFLMLLTLAIVDLQNSHKLVQDSLRKMQINGENS